MYLNHQTLYYILDSEGSEGVTTQISQYAILYVCFLKTIFACVENPTIKI